MSSNKEQIKESIQSFLKPTGIPVEDLKIKKVKESLKVIPLGELDLEKFCAHFSIENNSLLSVEFSGIQRNTEFLLTYKSKENLSDEALELFRIIEKKIDEELEKSLLVAIGDLSPKRVFESFEERIPSKIKDKYEISGDFGKVREWKAVVYLANSKGDKDPDVGEMGDIGYTMIDLDSGVIIPIARSDEHHQGYDLISHLRKNKMIPKGNYYPIYFGNNYVYSEYPEEVSRALRAFKIWRENGGENTSVSNGGNRRFDYTIKMDDFIKSNGKIEIVNGEIFPIGQRIVRYLDKCATLMKSHHEGKTIKPDMVANYAEMIVNELKDTFSFYSETQALQSAITQFRSDANLKKLEEALFSHNGFKNTLHMGIRAGIQDPRDFKARDVTKLFGDLEFANREFNRLSMI